jgi:hypothetical protein
VIFLRAKRISTSPFRLSAKKYHATAFFDSLALDYDDEINAQEQPKYKTMSTAAAQPMYIG